MCIMHLVPLVLGKWCICPGTRCSDIVARRRPCAPGVHVLSMHEVMYMVSPITKPWFCPYIPNPETPPSPGVHVLSMREAVFMVSPKMENLGSLLPTRPLQQARGTLVSQHRNRTSHVSATVH